MTRRRPYEIPEGTELPIYICGCGLVEEQALLQDGSHKKTRAEAAGEVLPNTTKTATRSWLQNTKG